MHQRRLQINVVTKIWQRFWGFVLLGLMLSYLGSCSVPSLTNTNQSNTIEIEFWTMQLQPQFNEYFNGLITQFEADNPGLSVRWIDVPWNAMESKILTAVSAGTAPDVVNLNPDFASQLASRKAWINLNELVPPDVQSQYLSNIWQASMLEEQSFGIPWYLTTRVAIYNQQLFEQADIAEPPQTFVDLAQVARQIKAKTGKYAFFITFVPEDSAEVLESLVQMGVQLVDEAGNAAFDSPAGRSAFQYWVDLYQAELLPQEVLTQGHRRAIELYQAGETALLVSSPEFFNSIQVNAPGIAEVSAASRQITGISGKKNVAVMNLVIPQATDEREASLKFALYVTNSENQLAFAKAANVLPSTVQALEQYQTELEAEGQEISPVTLARTISASQLTDAEVLVPAMADVNILQKVIYDNLQAAMLGEKTVDQAVTDAARAWNDRR